jgi:hypothetical protein
MMHSTCEPLFFPGSYVNPGGALEVKTSVSGFIVRIPVQKESSVVLTVWAVLWITVYIFLGKAVGCMNLYMLKW